MFSYLSKTPQHAGVFCTCQEKTLTSFDRACQNNNTLVRLLHETRPSQTKPFDSTNTSRPVETKTRSLQSEVSTGTSMFRPLQKMVGICMCLTCRKSILCTTHTEDLIRQQTKHQCTGHLSLMEFYIRLE